ncbi:DUF1822 family protein [Gloeocapsa sp. PCC 73106]|uniref:DUF1822 family protein n=1 Tax=Gloeocapsa sp. PCC 73106 TaxID=102232 RepID=UPI0002ACD761|nr:DUF1822 family protein [Gloeocapsa sp. PCC 73106]ELR96808.1 Protein of unknown function (DUF1822) [Gloeocapsa sp. PCC 73106]
MNIDDLANYDSVIQHQPPPQPGEIWEIGESRYLMIVNTVDDRVYSGIVISEKTKFMSDYNFVITQNISGISRDLLIEAWHLIEILDCHLVQKVGNRLSREIYDYILDVYDKSLENKNQNPLSFEKAEKSWGEFMEKQVVAYKTYQFTSQLIEAAIVNEQEIRSLNQPEIVLNQWLEDVFLSGWQKLTDLLNTPDYQLNYSLRSEVQMTTIQGIKSLSLGEETIATVMAVNLESNDKLGISIEIIPQGNQRYLPDDLLVNILSSSEEIVKSFQARSADNCLKLPKMKLSPNGEFTLEIISGEVTIREKFVHIVHD